MTASPLYFFAAFTLLSVAACARQEPATPAQFHADSAAVAVTSLARELEDNFIYPDKGTAYATMLRANLANGAYAQFSSTHDFASRVTADLQALNPEGHLRLAAPGETPATPFGGLPDVGKGVVHVGWAAPGVGYMSIHGYEGDSAGYQRLMGGLRAALEKLAGASTLIIDARYYVGGAFEETDVVASYLFADSTDLLDFDTRLDVERRGHSPVVEGPTMRRVAAPEGIVRRRQVVVPIARDIPLRRAKVYVLTSQRTASGGEGFTFALKKAGRVTLIGDRTDGAGHFGMNRDLGGGYRAFIPIGRPFDPATGKGWELTGIEPDVKVPAAQALDEALRRAGVDPTEGRRALRLPADFEKPLQR